MRVYIERFEVARLVLVQNQTYTFVQEEKNSRARSAKGSVLSARTISGSVEDATAYEADGRVICVLRALKKYERSMHKGMYARTHDMNLRW